MFESLTYCYWFSCFFLDFSNDFEWVNDRLLIGRFLSIRYSEDEAYSSEEPSFLAFLLAFMIAYRREKIWLFKLI